MQSNKTRKKNIRQSIWGSNIFTFLLFILLVLSFIKVSKEVLLRYEINKEIKQLENQLSELEDKTSKMDQLISYLRTDEYIEKEARLKLNFSKPGEKQINLSPSKFSQDDFIKNNNQANPIKWFNYFFK